MFRSSIFMKSNYKNMLRQYRQSICNSLANRLISSTTIIDDHFPRQCVTFFLNVTHLIVHYNYHFPSPHKHTGIVCTYICDKSTMEAEAAAVLMSITLHLKRPHAFMLLFDRLFAAWQLDV